MAQSRTMSVVETCASTLIGYFVALGCQLLVFPLFGVHLPLYDNLVIGLIFTVVALVRGYVVRRVFNAIKASA